MENVRVLLAEGTEDLLTAMASILETQYSILTCSNGHRALELLETYLPDIVVLDLELPGLDGFTLLQDAAEKGVRPVVLALTRLNNTYIAETASELGIQYIMMKPFDMHALSRRLAGLIRWYENQSRMTIQTVVTDQLTRFRIRDRLDGYAYLLDAVTLMMEGNRRFVTKEIYPDIGRKYGCSRESVEHSIRIAIQDAWKRDDSGVWRTYFPEFTQKSPSNRIVLNKLKQLSAAALQHKGGND